MSYRETTTLPLSTRHLSSSLLHLARCWGLVLLWTAGIFIFSSCRRPLGPLSRLECSGVIGRIAHTGEYAGLTILLYSAVARSRRGRRASLISLGLALAYAVFDELHQKFTPGRGFELADVGYDLAGVILSLGLIQVWKFIQRRRHRFH